MWIFDATPLGYLAKVDRLSLVQRFGASCVIPERVRYPLPQNNGQYQN